MNCFFYIIINISSLFYCFYNCYKLSSVKTISAAFFATSVPFFPSQFLYQHFLMLGYHLLHLLSLLQLPLYFAKLLQSLLYVQELLLQIQNNLLFPFLICFVVFYILNRYSYLIGDDWVYSFMQVGDSYYPMHSLKDAIIFQIEDYMRWSGRFVVHTLVSYFCGIMGMEIFKIFNSVVFTALVVGLVKLIRKEFDFRPAMAFWYSFFSFS